MCTTLNLRTAKTKVETTEEERMKKKRVGGVAKKSWQIFIFSQMTNPNQKHEHKALNLIAFVLRGLLLFLIISTNSYSPPHLLYVNCVLLASDFRGPSADSSSVCQNSLKSVCFRALHLHLACLLFIFGYDDASYEIFECSRKHYNRLKIHLPRLLARLGGVEWKKRETLNGSSQTLETWSVSMTTQTHIL